MLRFVGCLICLCWQANFIYADIAKYADSIIEDARLRSPELIRKYGYPVELHSINAKDGFQLTAHRIPKPGAQPVLLVHGLEDSSSGWLLLGPNTSFAYLLSDRGYDVWLLNTRGNRYSRKHSKYHLLNPQFWDFSFHQLGIYDLPATIDYIIANTNFKQLHYVGHSQGTTSFFVMGSERPAYMKKILLMQALAPVAYWNNIDNPYYLLVAPYINALVRLFHSVGIHELPPENEVWRELAYQLCSFAFKNTCTYIVMELMGWDLNQFNDTAIPLILGHYPAGSSVKSFGHYGQTIHRKEFAKYDYGPLQNRKLYGSDTPPKYKLGNVDCKVALYYGNNDYLAAVKDVQRLSRELGNVVHDELLAYKKFNHLDFVFGKDVKKLLYNSMFEVMAKVESGLLTNENKSMGTIVTTRPKLNKGTTNYRSYLTLK
ncbi:lipase 1 [Drosophila busckii]|uniref:lipase 1 n=1 Tax=Drosophila busckii TaxID=30019 RepID=UPI001432FF7E|nr:lipase 1 [Drosophila busckii]XP_017844628.2 lipase 1 [Drosophila busckii]